jgi:DNA-binding transcriptional MerR regulator
MLTPRRDVLLMGPADAARRLRISIKALKLYERVGIVTPKRTRRGWRLYSTDDLERISQALAFKKMGFGLSQIAGLLDASAGELATALTAQEHQLKNRRAELDDALTALREARRQFSPFPRLVA